MPPLPVLEGRKVGCPPLPTGRLPRRRQRTKGQILLWEYLSALLSSQQPQEPKTPSLATGPTASLPQSLPFYLMPSGSCGRRTWLWLSPLLLPPLFPPSIRQCGGCSLQAHQGGSRPVPTGRPGNWWLCGWKGTKEVCTPVNARGEGDTLHKAPLRIPRTP